MCTGAHKRERDRAMRGKRRSAISSAGNPGTKGPEVNFIYCDSLFSSRLQLFSSCITPIPVFGEPVMRAFYPSIAVCSAIFLAAPSAHGNTLQPGPTGSAPTDKSFFLTFGRDGSSDYVPMWWTTRAFTKAIPGQSRATRRLASSTPVKQPAVREFRLKIFRSMPSIQEAQAEALARVCREVRDPSGPAVAQTVVLARAHREAGDSSA